MYKFSSSFIVGVIESPFFYNAIIGNTECILFFMNRNIAFINNSECFTNSHCNTSSTLIG